MKKILIHIFFFFFHCSFDNKTGIWKTVEDDGTKSVQIFKDFKKLNTEEESFNDILESPKNLKIKLAPIKLNTTWLDQYYKQDNNFDNFKYTDLNRLVVKSKKLTKSKVRGNIVSDGENVIFSDSKGNIIVYSLREKKITYQYNFYKKKFKKIKKIISIALENNIIYASDNLGYVYALNYEIKKLLWAKNYKVPFRSNLKVKKKHIILADQNNYLYLLDKFDGEKTKTIPTEETILKNAFVNSLALNITDLFFLNTYGTLYSIDKKNLIINWFINLNRTLDLNPGNLFFSNTLVSYKDKLVILTDSYFYLVNSLNGSIIYKLPIVSLIKPVASGDKLFLITSNNLLVCLDLITGKIVYSVNISEEIGKFLQTKNKPINIKTLSLVNNNLYVFLNNSYLVKFNIIGSINKIDKLPENLNSLPIFINESLIYLNKKNKLIIVD